MRTIARRTIAAGHNSVIEDLYGAIAWIRKIRAESACDHVARRPAAARDAGAASQIAWIETHSIHPQTRIDWHA
jgi:hypothetical protein